MKSRIGIAGWPLRNLSSDLLGRLVDRINVDLIEIPKDLLDSISLKTLFEILTRSGKQVSLAGTTDFSGLAGFSWSDYSRYLAVQAAAARFLRCAYLRVFLNADTSEGMATALARLAEFSEQNGDVEILIETHGGYESTLDGFMRCIEGHPFRFVVDFANIRDAGLATSILDSPVAASIAYFHMRNLGDYCENEGLLSVETRARTAYPDHVFLWEPKAVSGVDALEVLTKHNS